MSDGYGKRKANLSSLEKMLEYVEKKVQHSVRTLKKW